VTVPGRQTGGGTRAGRPFVSDTGSEVPVRAPGNRVRAGVPDGDPGATSGGRRPRSAQASPVREGSHRSGSGEGKPRTGRERFAVLAIRTTRLAAVWSMLALLLHRLDWVHWVSDVFGVLNLPVAPSVFAVVLLLVLGGALRRRLRAALLVLLGFQLLGVIDALVTLLLSPKSDPADRAVGPGELSAVLVIAGLVSAVVLSVLLWWARPAFPARVAPASRLRAGATLAVGLALPSILSVGLTETFPGTLSEGRQRLAWAIRAAVGLPPDNADPEYAGHHGNHWIVQTVGLFSAGVLVAALLAFLRAGRRQRLLTADEELIIRRLLLAHGDRDSLGYFATRRDKAVVFSARADAAVTYRVIGSVGLASGDPLGSADAWDEAVAGWISRMRVHGWSPAAVSASEDGARAYVRAGLKALPMGDEAVVDVKSFTLTGTTMQPVRRAVARVVRAGYTVRVARHGSLSAAEFAEIADLAERGRGDEDERGFSMALGRLGDPADGRCVAVLAYDAAGVLRALLSLVPWGAHGLSLDLMRRDPEAENGITEYLVAGLMAAGSDLGVDRVSLNFAVLRAVFSAAERVGAGPIVRLGNAALTIASRFWQLKGLYRSNERYLPRWVPRYLCFDDSLAITSVAAAAGVAEGFVPWSGGRLGRALQSATLPGRGDPQAFAAQVAAQETELRLRARPAAAVGEQQRVRRDKLAVLRAAGMDPYPVTVPRSRDLGQLRTRYASLGPNAHTGDQVAVCGRVRALRDFGGLVIAVLQDGEDRIQILAGIAELAAAQHRLWRRAVDLGDHLSVTGEIVTSQTGELSVQATSWTMAAKCLRPLPDPRRTLTDPHARARHRYVELIVDHDSRRLLAQRSTATRALREGFTRRGYTEVETPVLQTVHGGANARPFTTHINAYNLDLYLRIAPELHLKRLCVSGMGKVFELNRNFRNEGADATHNPEFTSVEAYQAYADYMVMRDLTRELVLEVATAVHGTPTARRRTARGDLVNIDLTEPWPTMTVHDAVTQAAGTPVTVDTPADSVRAICRDHGLRSATDATAGELVVLLYEQLVERHTQYPTFYTDFPIETSPLTRTHRTTPALAERWDLVAFGTELGTAYSELVDPIDQRRRLTAQSLKAAAGDPEAMDLDEDFLTALEYAMPPTGGLGLGVDRLVMMLTGASIRATLAFPMTRPGQR